MNSYWFLCSTPLHVFTALSLADRLFPEEHKRLLLIDQHSTQDNDYFQKLQKLKHQPFAELSIFPGRIQQPLQKWRSRREVAQQLEQLVAKERPACLFTGNDRRIEFQRAMHLARQHNPNAVGVYMDEGTFTYVGRAASRSWNDRVVDNAFKKLIYGCWWENPETVGASSWISEVYAAFPEQVVAPLKRKKIRPILPEYYRAPAPSELAEAMLSDSQLTAKGLAEIRCLITPPHESLAQRQPRIKQAYQRQLQALIDAGAEPGKLAIKYHPRDSQSNWLNVNTEHCLILPQRVTFESLLPLLHEDTQILGDLSSTLLMARWMRPDLQVLAIKTSNSEHPFQKLLETLGAKVVR